MERLSGSGPLKVLLESQDVVVLAMVVEAGEAKGAANPGEALGLGIGLAAFIAELSGLPDVDAGAEVAEAIGPGGRHGGHDVAAVADALQHAAAKGGQELGQMLVAGP